MECQGFGRGQAATATRHSGGSVQGWLCEDVYRVGGSQLGLYGCYRLT